MSFCAFRSLTSGGDDSPPGTQWLGHGRDGHPADRPVITSAAGLLFLWPLRLVPGVGLGSLVAALACMALKIVTLSRIAQHKQETQALVPHVVVEVSRWSEGGSVQHCGEN